MKYFDDNPFAIPDQPRSSRRWWWIVVPLLSILASIVIPAGVRRALVLQLSGGIAELPAELKSERLRNLDQLGTQGLPALVGVVATGSASAAQEAYGIIYQRQEEQRSTVSHSVVYDDVLLRELRKRLEQFPDRRLSWVETLLNQVLLDSWELDSRRAQQIHRDALSLLNQVAAIHDSDWSIESSEAQRGETSPEIPADEVPALAESQNPIKLKIPPTTPVAETSARGLPGPRCRRDSRHFRSPIPSSETGDF